LAEHCTFCKIVKNKIPASYVYKDDRTIAFLDAKPANRGHTLVIPKKHYENIYEISDEEVAYLYKIVKKVAIAVRKGVNADGISILQNNGQSAGQVIFHLHVHIIPRYRTKKTWHRRDAGREELDDIAEDIRLYVEKSFR
jgi:histidine triad (HIT) family protein